MYEESKRHAGLPIPHSPDRRRLAMASLTLILARTDFRSSRVFQIRSAQQILFR
jgi:hypothetical protein